MAEVEVGTLSRSDSEANAILFDEHRSALTEDTELETTGISIPLSDRKKQRSAVAASGATAQKVQLIVTVDDSSSDEAPVQKMESNNLEDLETGPLSHATAVVHSTAGVALVATGSMGHAQPSEKLMEVPSGDSSSDSSGLNVITVGGDQCLDDNSGYEAESLSSDDSQFDARGQRKKKRKTKKKKMKGTANVTHVIAGANETSTRKLLTSNGTANTKSKCNVSCFGYCSCLQALKENGDLPAVFLTLLVWAVFIVFVLNTDSIIWVVVFPIVYVLYLLECFASNTWQYLKEQQSGDGTVALLDKLRKTAPILEWAVNAYHYEEYLRKPEQTKEIIVWVYGNETEAEVLRSAGYFVEVCESSYTTYTFCNQLENRKNLACVIVPIGRDGNTIKQQLTDKLKHASSFDLTADTAAASSGGHSSAKVLPQFLCYDASVEELTESLILARLLVKSRRRVVTHRAKMDYPFTSWSDTSQAYPLWEHVFTKLTLNKSYNVSDTQTQEHMTALMEQFKQDNYKDNHIDFIEVLQIDGFKHSICVSGGDSGNDEFKAPCWMTRAGYWLFSICMLTLYPRWKMTTIVGEKEWTLSKCIKTVPE